MNNKGTTDLSKRKTSRSQYLKHGLHIVFILTMLLAILPVINAAQASTPPILDGKVDPEYLSSGQQAYFQGFAEEVSANLYAIDDSSIDPDHIWLTWVVADGYTDNSYDDDGANGQSQHPTWGPGFQHRFRDIAESDLQQIKLCTRSELSMIS